MRSSAWRSIGGPAASAAITPSAERSPTGSVTPSRPRPDTKKIVASWAVGLGVGLGATAGRAPLGRDWASSCTETPHPATPLSTRPRADGGHRRAAGSWRDLCRQVEGEPRPTERARHRRTRAPRSPPTAHGRWPGRARLPRPARSATPVPRANGSKSRSTSSGSTPGPASSTWMRTRPVAGDHQDLADPVAVPGGVVDQVGHHALHATRVRDDDRAIPVQQGGLEVAPCEDRLDQRRDVRGIPLDGRARGHAGDLQQVQQDPGEAPGLGGKAGDQAGLTRGNVSWCSSRSSAVATTVVSGERSSWLTLATNRRSRSIREATATAISLKRVGDRVQVRIARVGQPDGEVAVGEAGGHRRPSAGGGASAARRRSARSPRPPRTPRARGAPGAGRRCAASRAGRSGGTARRTARTGCTPPTA